MGLDFFIYYAEANVVCIIILFIVLVNDRLYGMMQEKQIWFKRTIMAHILYFVSDTGWAATLSDQLPKTRLMVLLFNLTNYILLSMIGYGWFMYMAVSERMSFWKDKRKKRLWRLPVWVSAAVIIIAYIINPTFWINEQNELNNLYYPMLVAVPALYLCVALVVSIKNARKAEAREDKKTFLLIGFYPVAVFSFGIVQLILLKAPTFCFGVTIMVLFFSLQNMRTQISVDALTRLNNRGQIIRHMEQLNHHEDTEVLIMMIDLDHFKEINDTYGHAEGDRALILVSEALKNTCAHIKSPVFIGRYGGDEFTIIIQNPDPDHDPERVAGEIRRALLDKTLENRLPYALEASIGYEGRRDQNDTMQACMIRADEKLYLDKQNKKSRKKRA